MQHLRIWNLFGISFTYLGYWGIGNQSQIDIYSIIARHFLRGNLRIFKRNRMFSESLRFCRLRSRFRVHFRIPPCGVLRVLSRSNIDPLVNFESSVLDVKIRALRLKFASALPHSPKLKMPTFTSNRCQWENQPKLNHATYRDTLQCHAVEEIPSERILLANSFPRFQPMSIVLAGWKFGREGAAMVRGVAVGCEGANWAARVRGGLRYRHEHPFWSLSAAAAAPPDLLLRTCSIDVLADRLSLVDNKRHAPALRNSRRDDARGSNVAEVAFVGFCRFRGIRDVVKGMVDRANGATCWYGV